MICIYKSEIIVSHSCLPFQRGRASRGKCPGYRKSCSHWIPACYQLLHGLRSGAIGPRSDKRQQQVRANIWVHFFAQWWREPRRGGKRWNRRRGRRPFGCPCFEWDHYHHSADSSRSLSLHCLSKTRYRSQISCIELCTRMTWCNCKHLESSWTSWGCLDLYSCSDWTDYSTPHTSSRLPLLTRVSIWILEPHSSWFLYLKVSYCS